MQPRGRIDFGWLDFLRASVACLFPGRPEKHESSIRSTCGEEARSHSTLRCAWDLLLQSLALPSGTEVVVSAVNIPDMFDILRHHDLVPVPVDLDPDTLAPKPDALKAAIGPRTGLVLIVHLLGSKVPMDPVFALTQERGIPVVEDCAHAFTGPEQRGDARSLASLFSFGPLKTHTSLGGCIAFIRDPELRIRMTDIQRAYPRQPKAEYAALIAKYLGLALLSRPLPYGVFVWLCKLLGSSHDTLINRTVMGLRGDDYWKTLRRRPSRPLLATLARRITTHSPQTIERRIARAEQLMKALPPEVQVFGAKAGDRCWWQFAINIQHPEEVISTLRSRGYDATQGSSRLRPADEASDCTISSALERIVYLPIHEGIDGKSIDAMAQLLTSSPPLIPTNGNKLRTSLGSQ